jgi:membrane protease YdiL (CAAX protease family)
MVMTSVRAQTGQLDAVRVARSGVRSGAVGWGWPLGLLFLRLGIIAGGMGIVFGVARLLHSPQELLYTLTAAMPLTLIANLVSLEILIWRGHAEGFKLRQLIGFRGGLVPVLKDLGWSLLWLLGLNLLFNVTFVGVAYAIARPTDVASVSNAINTMFIGDMGGAVARSFPLWYSILIAVLFPLVNSLFEEMHYRGYIQPRLVARSKHTWIGIPITALAFGAQYSVYAWAWGTVPILIAAYFVWGLFAGIISHLHRRIVPLLLAHFVVSIPVAGLPLLYSSLGLLGQALAAAGR